MTVAGVLLAAGESTRFGASNKLLEPVDGIPIVRRAAETLVAADVSPVVVVLGADARDVRAAIAALPVHVVENPDYDHGQATSVATGVTAVADRADAFVIALGDMPWVSPQSVNALVAAYRAGEGEALAASYQGTRGNPVLFDRQYTDALLAIDGDVGGRDIIREEGRLIETGDPGVRQDVDTPEDLDTTQR